MLVMQNSSLLKRPRLPENKITCDEHNECVINNIVNMPERAVMSRSNVSHLHLNHNRQREHNRPAERALHFPYKKVKYRPKEQRRDKFSDSIQKQRR